MCAPLHVDIVVSCLLYRRIPNCEQPEFWLKKTSVFQLIIEVGLVEVVRVPLNRLTASYIYLGCTYTHLGLEPHLCAS